MNSSVMRLGDPLGMATSIAVVPLRELPTRRTQHPPAESDVLLVAEQDLLRDEPGSPVRAALAAELADRRAWHTAVGLDLAGTERPLEAATALLDVARDAGAGLNGVRVAPEHWAALLTDPGARYQLATGDFATPAVDDAAWRDRLAAALGFDDKTEKVATPAWGLLHDLLPHDRVADYLRAQHTLDPETRLAEFGAGLSPDAATQLAILDRLFTSGNLPVDIPHDGPYARPPHHVIATRPAAPTTVLERFGPAMPAVVRLYLPPAKDDLARLDDDTWPQVPVSGEAQVRASGLLSPDRGPWVGEQTWQVVRAASKGGRSPDVVIQVGDGDWHGYGAPRLRQLAEGAAAALDKHDVTVTMADAADVAGRVPLSRLGPRPVPQQRRPDGRWSPAPRPASPAR